MSRKEVFKEMEDMFGFVPTFFKSIPDSSLSEEWELYKRIETDSGPIPPKYRQLIGLGISAASRCQYCTFYHTEMAKVYGASDEEIEAAVHYAKLAAGWSTYLNGTQTDLDKFKSDVKKACDHARSVGARR